VGAARVETIYILGTACRVFLVIYLSMDVENARGTGRPSMRRGTHSELAHATGLLAGCVQLRARVCEPVGRVGANIQIAKKVCG
jgi:hypothetical protein